MRIAPIVLAALLSVAGFAVSQSSGPSGGASDDDDAESGNQTSSSSSSSSSASRSASPSPSPKPSPSPAPAADDGREWCKNGGRSQHELDECEEFRDDLEGLEDERWISYDLGAAEGSIANYTVSGLLVLESLRVDFGNGSPQLDQTGRVVRLADNDTELSIYDDPSGLIRFKAGDGSARLDFPASAHVQRESHGARLQYDAGRSALLLSGNVTWTAPDVAVLDGFFTLHVLPGEAVGAASAQPEYREAVEQRRVGAEISLKAPGAASAAAAGDEPVEVKAYDDVDVDVEFSNLAKTPDKPIRVVVSSELKEGRTIVLHLDPSVAGDSDPKDLLLRYYDLHPQADGSVLDTEVVFRQASDLEDVLDPSDDAGQPEYWVVRDANGLQILVSVTHWSAHAITVASIADTLSQPSVILGIVIGAGGCIAAAALLFWPRRRDD